MQLFPTADWHMSVPTQHNCNTLLPIIARRSMWMCFDERSWTISTFMALLPRKLYFKMQPPTISWCEGKGKVHPKTGHKDPQGV